MARITYHIAPLVFIFKSQIIKLLGRVLWVYLSFVMTMVLF